jgi:hypothetical protein
MTIEIINDREKWDEFIEKSPYGLLFHKWDFLKIIEKYSGFKLFTYGIYKEDQLISIVPFFYYKKFILKMMFSPPPRSAVPHLGFIVNNEFDELKQNKKEDYLKTIFTDINNELSKKSLNYINISTVANFSDIRQFRWNGYLVEPKFTYILNLSNPIEKIWADFKQEARKGIMKAENAGFRLESDNDTVAFYQKLRDRYKEQKLNEPIFCEKYIEDLINQFQNNIKLYYLYNNKNELMSCVITQEYKDRFVFWLGSIRSEGYANEYLIWSFIQRAKSEKYKIFDFTGANTENICRFKSKFNPQLEQYYNLCKKSFLSNFVELTYMKLIRKRIY